MTDFGLGTLLADDMGLGKTVQVLALLDSLREKNVKSLLIIPASLIGNWEKECRRFAPELRYKVLHTQSREFSLDEAQVIKNPATKQTRAIKAIEADMRIALTGTPVEGIQRKGLVLATIMKLKQLCNHPDQYLDTGAFAQKQSGKFEKLAELCETINEQHERVLVFTQFKEVTDALATFLGRQFGQEGLVLHGGTPIKKRTKLIEQFNGDDYVPFMVLSLKAGSVGLNLTGANHVIHFDRWWNPAVENQATDRAFRIGQQKNVFVHKLIALGTIEEKIDAMLEEKTKLANEVISDSSEAWITEMTDEELLQLLTLEA